MIRLILLLMLLFMIFLLIMMVKQYRRCPADKLMVVYGKGTGNQAARCYHGGAVFVFPVVQDYDFIELKPYTIEKTQTVRASGNVPFQLSLRAVVAVSDDEEVMQNAAERLLGLEREEISGLAAEVIGNSVQTATSTSTFDEISREQDQYEDSLRFETDSQLRKLGMHVISFSIHSIQTGEGNGTGQTAESKCQKTDSFPKQEYGKSDTDTACRVAHV